jgi:hypothetical protein
MIPSFDPLKPAPTRDDTLEGIQLSIPNEEGNVRDLQPAGQLARQKFRQACKIGSLEHPIRQSP